MCMEQHIEEKIKEIKKSLRLAMNGVVSTLQRRQGLNYKINFGVEIPRIKELAAKYKKEKQLANSLWKENIRECRILAILIMPVEEFTKDDADCWIATAQYTELADQLSMHLLSRIPNAAEYALSWAQGEESITAYCGFATFAHLLRKGTILSKEQQQMYLSITARTLDRQSEPGIIVKQCAFNTFAVFTETEQADRDEIDKHDTLREILEFNY